MKRILVLLIFFANFCYGSCSSTLPNEEKPMGSSAPNEQAFSEGLNRLIALWDQIKRLNEANPLEIFFDGKALEKEIVTEIDAILGDEKFDNGKKELFGKEKFKKLLKKVLAATSNSYKKEICLKFHPDHYAGNQSIKTQLTELFTFFDNIRKFH